MSLKKLVNITPAELKAKGVAALADRPNLVASYGVGGLSPTNLKLWFDQIGKFIAEKINLIQDVLSSDEAASYVKLDLTGLDAEKEAIEGFAYSLQDLADSFLDGKFMAWVLGKQNATAKELLPLQTILNNIAKSLSDLQELSDENILDHKSIRNKIESDILSHDTNVQAHQDIRAKIGVDIAAHNGDMKAHSAAMALKFNRSDIMPVFSGEDINNEGKVPSAKALNGVVTNINSKIDSSVGGLNDTYKAAYKSVSYDNDTGLFTLTKFDGTTDVVSFPLESFVADATFDPTTNKVTLIIANGKSVSFDLSALIDYYYGDGTTIEVYDDPNDGFKHKIRVKSTFLDNVNAAILGIDKRLTQAEKEIELLGRVDEFGKPDGTTITMDDNALLSARKLKLADNSFLEFVQLTKSEYDSLEKLDNSVLYIIDDDSRLAIALGDKILYASGVKDTETNSSITFRVITQAAYDGLAEKDNTKLYIINKDGALAFAFGDLYLDTNKELISVVEDKVARLESAHKTLVGANKVAIFNSFAVSGIDYISGTIQLSEGCLQC